jgi:hypothetical protein
MVKGWLVVIASQYFSAMLLQLDFVDLNGRFRVRVFGDVLHDCLRVRALIDRRPLKGPNRAVAAPWDVTVAIVFHVEFCIFAVRIQHANLNHRMRLLLRDSVPHSLATTREGFVLTDVPPQKSNRAGFLESDRIKGLDLLTCRRTVVC